MNRYAGQNIARTPIEDDQAIAALEAAGKAAVNAAAELYRSTGPILDAHEGNKALRLMELIQDAAGTIRTAGASLLGEAEIWRKAPPPGNDYEPTDETAS
jgi:hypothetical protein